MQRHSGKILGHSEKFQVIDCKYCQFTHINPIPTFEELEDFYTHKKDFVSKNLSFKKALSKINREKTYWKMIFSNRIRKAQTLSNYKEKKPFRILDIGSQLGMFLQTAKELNCDILGIEPSQIPYHYLCSLDLPVLNAPYEKVSLTEIGTFDFIHLSYVIEHLPDPKHLFQTAYKLLKPKGILCIEAPNDFNILQKALVTHLNKKNYWIHVPVHVNYFHFESLSKLFTKTGFTIVQKESGFPLELFILMGMDYLDNPKIGKKIHTMRMLFEKNLNAFGLNELKENLYRSFADQGIGRNCIIYGQK